MLPENDNRMCQDKCIDIIQSCLEDKCDKKICLEDELSALDINSITFISIIVAIENAFDFEFDDEMLLFTVFPTVKSMIDYVETKIK